MNGMGYGLLINNNYQYVHRFVDDCKVKLLNMIFNWKNRRINNIPSMNVLLRKISFFSF